MIPSHFSEVGYEKMADQKGLIFADRQVCYKYLIP
jgi:hypothetical protein